MSDRVAGLGVWEAVVGGFERAIARRWGSWVVVALVMGAGLLLLAWLAPPPEGGAAAFGWSVTLAVFAAAVVCEFVDSSLGMGYGTTLTPLLLLAGFNPLDVVPTVLLSELLTGAVAAVLHHREGNVDLLHDGVGRRTALWLSALSLVGALVAVGLSLHVSKFWLTAIIGGIVTAVGILIIATVKRRLRYRPRRLLLLGGIAAFNKALSGGGYGPLVTGGQVVLGVSPRNAVAITSLSESFTCLVGLVAYLAWHGGIDAQLAAPLMCGALASVPLATLTVRRLSETPMRLAVGLTACALGLLTLTKLWW